MRSCFLSTAAIWLRIVSFLVLLQQAGVLGVCRGADRHDAFIRPIVVSGDGAPTSEMPFPNASGGTLTSSFPPGVQLDEILYSPQPTIDSAGYVYFSARRSDGRIGTWLGRERFALTHIVSEGDLLPSSQTGAALTRVQDGVNPSPTATAGVFAGIFSGPNAIPYETDDGLWSFTLTDGLNQVALAGDPAPGMGPDAFFLGRPDVSGFYPGPVNGKGDAAFMAFVGGTSQYGIRSLWASIGNEGPSVIAYDGMMVTTGDRQLQIRGARAFGLNDSGDVGFRGLSGDNSANGLWIKRLKEEPVLVAEVGQAIYNLPGEEPPTLDLITNEVLNDAGEVLFAGTLSNGRRKIFQSHDVAPLFGVATIPVSGDPAPDVGEGITFSSVANQTRLLAINPSGQAVYAGTLEGEGITTDNDVGIWAVDGDQHRLVYRENAVAPGFDGEVTFAPLGSFALGTPIFTQNERGQVAFNAPLSGEGLPEHALGIFAEDAAGKLQLVVADGQQIEVYPGVFWTVESAYFKGINFLPEGDGINANGQVAFFAKFTNGETGVFVSELVAVPEPSGLILTLTVVFSAILRRARR